MTIIVTGGAGFIGSNFIFHMLEAKTAADGIKKTIKWYLEHRDWWEEAISGEYRNYYER